jgi:hypothetical protein
MFSVNVLTGWRIPNNSQAGGHLTPNLYSSLYLLQLPKVKFKITLLLAVYRQSVRLGVKLLETHDQTFFFN